MAKKHWLSSKTVWFGIIQAALACSIALGGPDAGLPHGAAAYFGASGIITIVLRFLTSQAVSS